MRYCIIFFISFLVLQSCDTSAPDVSDIKVELKLQRFEDDFFKLDSASYQQGLVNLLSQYNSFGKNFLWRILEADPAWPADTLASYLQGFKQNYLPIYDTIKKQYPDFTQEKKEIEQMLRYVRHYFPAYAIPSKLITYLGPLNGYGDLLDTDAIVVGLQQHLGSDFQMYQSEFVATTYPSFISKRFTREYIEVNAAERIVDDMYPIKEGDFTLIEMMVQRGKKLYLMKRLLPSVPEHLIIGYTKDQWKGSEEREDFIWAFFLQNNLLQNKDLNLTKNYIGDSPKTQELGEASPGNIGAFCGWKIVESYMKQNKNLSLDELMKIPDQLLYKEAKYKP